MDTLITLKQALIKIHNEVMERHARQLIDKEYFIDKANHFGKKSPERASNMQLSNQNEAEIFWSKMLLKVIKRLIGKEE